MKTIIIYDSVYGNTKEIALAISKELKGKLIHVNDVKINEINNYDLLIIGTPTHAAMPTKDIQDFLSNLPKLNIKFATFSTGIYSKDKNFFLKILIKILGYASIKMSRQLKKKGYVEIIKNKDFLVFDKKGPLLKKEIDKAIYWVKSIN